MQSNTNSANLQKKNNFNSFFKSASLVNYQLKIIDIAAPGYFCTSFKIVLSVRDIELMFDIIF